MGATDRIIDGFQHFHDAVRCARLDSRLAGHQHAGIENAETIHVFGGIDRFDHLARVDMLGQRQLDQNTVNGRICVQDADTFKQLFFGEAGVV